MEEENISRLEILENILEFYKIQPGMRKDGEIEKIEEYLLLMHALYSDYSDELNNLEMSDVDFLENLFDCFNGYLNAVGEEMDQIFEKQVVDLSCIPIYGFSILLPIHSIEMVKKWNNFDLDDWQINEGLLELEGMVESDSFSENFGQLIKKLMSRINSRLIVELEELI